MNRLSMHKYYYRNNHNCCNDTGSIGELHQEFYSLLRILVALRAPAAPVPEISVNMVPKINEDGTVVGFSS